MNNLIKVNDVHIQHIATIVTLGLTLGLLDAIKSSAYCITVVTAYYILLIINILILRTFISHGNIKVLKILFYILTLFYIYIIVNLLLLHNVDPVRALALVTLIALLSQALSVNLDHITMKKNFTALDICILCFATYALLSSSLSADRIIILLSIIVLYIHLLFISITPSSVLTPLLTYILSLYDSTLFAILMYIPYVAYLYGYAKSINDEATLTPCHDITSVYFFILVPTLASIIHILFVSGIKQLFISWLFCFLTLFLFIFYSILYKGKILQ